tara:strand:- start:169 stop:1437 length:1269 start_codon:yes stop_codon:yes gene_type:complete
MTDKKTTVMVLSDHPLSPSGVGTQTKYFIEAMLKTGKYRFICFGGAVKHEDYNPVKVDPYGDDWVIFPVDGYGTPDAVRSCIAMNKPDILWMMTDPRFYTWLWEIENEIRAAVPIVYYHVWDNYPYPDFNKPWYDSNDTVVTISKVTSDIVRTVSPQVEEYYIPHAVDMNTFRKVDDVTVDNFRKDAFGPTQHVEGKMLFFWNNRNARRKQSGSLIFWFKKFLDNVGRDKAVLLMHTDPRDPHGQDLVRILDYLGLTNGEVMLSTTKLPPEHLAAIYNMADCTINISDAEGFGLATFESLSCETPIIVNMTGGLQEQVTDGINWFGIGIDPTSKAIIGSQEVPYIYEDRISEEAFVGALTKFYNLSPQERALMGKLGRKHLHDKYSMENFATKWDKVLTNVVQTCGSWDTRKNYQSWELKEV